MYYFGEKGKYLGYIFSLQTGKIALINKLSKHFLSKIKLSFKNSMTVESIQWKKYRKVEVRGDKLINTIMINANSECVKDYS